MTERSADSRYPAAKSQFRYNNMRDEGIHESGGHNNSIT